MHSHSLVLGFRTWSLFQYHMDNTALAVAYGGWVGGCPHDTGLLRSTLGYL